MQTLAMVRERKTLQKVLVGSVFLAVCSQLSLPLPFTPIPISMQSFAVMCVGAALGPKLGMYAVILFLLEGIAGLPVFTFAGSGIQRLLSPSGGYLLFHPFLAYGMGYCVRRKLPGALAQIFLLILLEVVVGTVWTLSFVKWDLALQMACFPFIILDITKALCVYVLYRGLKYRLSKI